MNHNNDALAGADVRFINGAHLTFSCLLPQRDLLPQRGCLRIFIHIS